MDPYKIAFILEALDGFTVNDLVFLHQFIQAKLTRRAATESFQLQATAASLPTVSHVPAVTALPVQATTAQIQAPAAVQEPISHATISQVPTLQVPEIHAVVQAPVESKKVLAAPAPVATATAATSESKKSAKKVKWADVAAAAADVTAPKAPKAAKKAIIKTPHSKMAADKTADKLEKAGEKAGEKAPRVERLSIQSAPREKPCTGKTWTNFCASDKCGCLYTFRDGCSAVTEDGFPIESAEDPEMTGWVAGDRHLDQARFDAGVIYGNQLYVRGWDPELVKWEAVRNRLREELQKMQAVQIFVDDRGFAFILFPSHELAAKAQRALINIPSFFGDILLVNFATRK